MMRQILLNDLQVLDYQSALNIQIEHFEKIINIKLENRNSGLNNLTPNFFFFVTHPPTYTMGKNGNYANILFSENELKERSISFFQTNRGGDITFHGLGQIVGYPILDLDNFDADIHLYMRNLEEVIIKTVAEYGLKSERSESETGVWLDVGKINARKICAMGVHTSRWVTMHGFALNVNTDLSYFERIVPCGILNKGVTSLEKELGMKIDEKEVKKKILNNFEEVFNSKFS
jgi:lipoyl(octanoyl) transferase